MEAGTRNTRWSVVMGMGLMVMVGCQTENVMTAAPSWLSRVPGGQHELCAIGVSGPTYYKEDAMAHSKAQAITELSRALKVKVKADLLITERGDHRGSSSKIEGNSEFSSDVLLKNVQVKEQWIHPGGNDRHGVRGTVYTLACVPIPR